MSLDVYLEEIYTLTHCEECEQPHEHTRSKELYHGNVTHNLVLMAQLAGLYDCLWRPDEHGMTLACHLIDPLSKGYAELNKNFEKYYEMNPTNGWGSLDGLIQFVNNYLDACKKYPNAHVRVCR